MEFKDVVEKIMKDDELRSQLQNLDSFDKICDFFNANGYKCTTKELRDQLTKNGPPLRTLNADDLENVAGGISGKQIMAACAGIMMLTGSIPAMNINTHAATTSSVLKTALKVTSIKSPAKPKYKKIDKLSRKQIIRLTQLLILYLDCNLFGICTQDSDCGSKSKIDYVGAFFMTEALKNASEIIEIISDKNYKEFRSQLDKLFTSTDAETFNSDEFNKKTQELRDKYSLSDEILDDIEYSIGNDIEKAYGDLWFKLIKKKQVLKGLDKPMERYKKTLSTIFDKEYIKNLYDWADTVIKEKLDENG